MNRFAWAEEDVTVTSTPEEARKAAAPLDRLTAGGAGSGRYPKGSGEGIGTREIAGGSPFASSEQVQHARDRASAKFSALPVPTEVDRAEAKARHARSGRHGGDDRPGSQIRKQRKADLLAEFGDGTTAPCVACGVKLNISTISMDRITPGSDGGGYNLANLIPMDYACNRARSNQSFSTMADGWSKPIVAAAIRDWAYADGLIPVKEATGRLVGWDDVQADTLPEGMDDLPSYESYEEFVTGPVDERKVVIGNVGYTKTTINGLSVEPSSLTAGGAGMSDQTQSWELQTSERSVLTENSLTAATGPNTSGVMVALVPDSKISQALLRASKGTEPLEEIHITLLYLGSVDEAGDQGKLLRAVQDFAASHGPLTGKPNGWGVFANGDENVLVALWDIPGIAEFRADLRRACFDGGVTLRKDDHGFTPHSTMRYESEPITTLPPTVTPNTCDFAEVTIAWGDYPWLPVPLGTPTVVGGGAGSGRYPKGSGQHTDINEGLVHGTVVDGVYRRKLGGSAVDMHVFLPAEQKMVAGVLDRAEEVFPGATIGLASVGSKYIRGRTYGQYTGSQKKIEIAWQTFNNPAGLDPSFEDGWFWPGQKATRQSQIIAHEVGHHIAEFSMDIHQRAKLANSLGLTPFHPDPKKDLYYNDRRETEWFRHNQMALSSIVSKYGAGGKEEMFAEMIGGAMFGDSHGGTKNDVIKALKETSTAASLT